MAANRVDTLRRVERLRAETPGCGNGVHFDNAGAALMPAPVLAAMHRHLDLEAEIGGYAAAARQQSVTAGFYTATAELLHCQPENIAFTSSATDAVARALSAIPFAPDDVVLTTEDDYVSHQLAFLALRKRFGIEVVHAPTLPEGGVDVDAMAAQMRTRRPRGVVVSHVPTNSGAVQPVAQIGRQCRELDLLYVVDAAQSVGQLPLDVEAIGCDFLAGTCRKFLRGPRGAGLLYVSERVLEEGYEPLFIDVRGARWVAPERYEPVADARRFEEWESSTCSVVGSAVAARYAVDLGLAWTSQRSVELGRLLRERLRALDGVRVLDRGAELCAIVTITVAGWRPEALKAELERRSVSSSVSLRDYALRDFLAKDVDGCLRLSPHYYNTEAEVEFVVAAVAEIVAHRVG